jgi:hypothetical protein
VWLPPLLITRPAWPIACRPVPFQAGVNEFTHHGGEEIELDEQLMPVTSANHPRCQKTVPGPVIDSPVVGSSSRAASQAARSKHLYTHKRFKMLTCHMMQKVTINISNDSDEDYTMLYLTDSDSDQGGDSIPIAHRSMAHRPLPFRARVNKFTNPGGEEIELAAPKSLDDAQFQRLLTEAKGLGWCYIPELSLGDKARHPWEDSWGVDATPLLLTSVDGDTDPPSAYGDSERIGQEIPSIVPRDPTSSAVAIIVKAQDGSVKNAVALIKLNEKATPANVLAAICTSTEPHV